MLFLQDSLCCSDGSCGTDEAAEMAAYTFSAHDPGLAGGVIEIDSLMPTILGYGVIRCKSLISNALSESFSNHKNRLHS